MKMIKVFESVTCGYFVRIKKKIQLPKLQKLCQDIDCELATNGYYGSFVNLNMSENSIGIVATICEPNGDVKGTVGAISKYIDDKDDCYEMYAFHSNVISKELSKEDWAYISNDVHNCFLSVLYSC